MNRSIRIPHLKPLGWLGALLLALLGQACLPHAKFINFNENGPIGDGVELIGEIPELHVQVDDRLSINVRTLDMRAAAPYNLNITLFGESVGNQNNIGTVSDYLVDSEGFIDFPQLGRLNVLGKTLSEVKDTLQQLLSPVLQEPVIIVRFANFKFTVLGEVNAPGTYSIQEDRVTLLEAIGSAGDLTFSASRENILVIRELDDTRQFARLDLHDPAIFQSEYFFLRQNDVIYIEPLPQRTASARSQLGQVLPWISLVSSVTTLVLTFANVFR
jgi:polysaccharide biosynthesis/export protein